jgi:1-acyl-sn-glycerol-3-phosphate acyltransferase
MIATCPDIGQVPRVILNHVTDIIIAYQQGKANYKKKKRYVRFKGKEVESYMKLYDGDPIEWSQLPPPIYAKYEILRHIMSQRLTNQANDALYSDEVEDTTDEFLSV